MSRNRLSELLSPTGAYSDGNASQPTPYDNYDLERNEPVTGDRYELQDRSGQKLGLNEFLYKVEFYQKMILITDQR